MKYEILVLDISGQWLLTLSCMNLGHRGNKYFPSKFSSLYSSDVKFNKSRGITTLLWQRTRMLLRNNNMQERHRTPRILRSNLAISLLKSLFNKTKTQQEMQCLAVENISWYNSKEILTWQFHVCNIICPIIL